jgi:sugar phosphate isomerase/epimerase
VTLIDLHCHTQPLSTCSSLSADRLVELAKARGLDGVCLTEHDRFWAPGDLAELRERTSFLILDAVELTTDMGHVLAFGLQELRAEFAFAAKVFEAAQEWGALLYLAHPARDGLLRVNADTVRFFESVEAKNGSDTRLQNLAASGLATGFRLPGIAGVRLSHRERSGPRRHAVLRSP